MDAEHPRRTRKIIRDHHRRGDQPELVDTIGAGDSFNTGFLSSYLKDEEPIRAAAMGNVTGALSTLRTGGTKAFRDIEFREAFLKQHAIAVPGA